MTAIPTHIFEARHGRRQIDGRAWACIEKCRRKLGLDEIPLPIPIERWIEGPLEITYGITDLSHLGAEVLGAADAEEREILIDSKVLDHEGRARFTCAHELGHLVLHGRRQTVFEETAEPFARHRNRLEREADRFAAAFLMPLPLLEVEVVSVLDEMGLDRAACIVELMKTTVESEWLWRNHFLPAVVRRFDVSRSAAINRFNDIEPRLDERWPLLPFDLIPRLLAPSRLTPELQDVHIVDGVPVRRDLFGG